MRHFFTIAFLFVSTLVGCAGPTLTEHHCAGAVDCARGTYCDAATSLCAMDCASDDECAPGMFCTVNGRCFREDAPPPPPDMSPVLEVVAGSLEDITVMSGTSDAELLRFDLVNRSDRDMILGMLPAGFAHEDGTPAEAGSFTDVKFVGRADLYTLAGPQDLNPEVGGNLYFDDEIPLPAGETTTLVLRADLGGSGRYLVTVGALVALLEDVVYADTHERVPADRILGNSILGRVIDVMNVEEMTADGTTALVIQFRNEQGVLHPSDSWQLLGTLFLNSYGGDSVFRSIGVDGANLGPVVSDLTLAIPGGPIVGEVTHPVGSVGTLRPMVPVTVPESGEVVYEVWGRIPTLPEYHGVLTFNVSIGILDAEAYDHGRFATIVSAYSESRFHIWETSPSIVDVALPSAVLVNDVEQDLFKFQVSSEVPGETFHIGSLTFRIDSGTSGTVSNLRIRVGSTLLSTSLYRLVRTNTGAPLGPSDSVGPFVEQVTVVFTESPGLTIFGTGQLITLVGTPTGFTTGNELRVLFGDRAFSYSFNVLWSDMSPEGRLGVWEGGLTPFYAVDPIVWRTASMGEYYTGAWEISDLNGVGRLTR